MDASVVTMGLMMGFAGSLHCAGMCGPIVLIMPFQQYKGAEKIVALSLYHFGRISVYALMAVVLYSFRGLFQPTVQQYISIIMGVLLLLTGILSFLPLGILPVKLPWETFVKRQLSNVIGKPGLVAIAITGILNGMLPCGLVYMALSASIMLGSAANAAAMLYWFGIGTVPMLVTITLLKSRLRFLQAKNIKKLVPVMVFIMGGLFVLRGLNLGIPYLSPKIEVSAGVMHSSCCHKK
jgi:sulfite exporter TauE/SafE